MDAFQRLEFKLFNFISLGRVRFINYQENRTFGLAKPLHHFFIHRAEKFVGGQHGYNAVHPVHGIPLLFHHKFAQLILGLMYARSIQKYNLIFRFCNYGNFLPQQPVKQG